MIIIINTIKIIQHPQRQTRAMIPIIETNESSELELELVEIESKPKFFR